MLVAVVDKTTSGRFAAGQVAFICQGLTMHFAQHVAPALNLAPWQIRYFPSGIVPSASRVMLLVDHAGVQGAAGYHDESGKGIPEAYISVEDCIAAGYSVNGGPNSVATVIDHEFLELAFDQSTTSYFDRGDGTEIAGEVSDPCENQGEALLLNGQKVWCSDFVYLSYFDIHGLGQQVFNWLGGITKPFQILPGGYAIIRDAQGNVNPVYGEKFPDFKKTWKEREGSHLSQRRKNNSPRIPSPASSKPTDPPPPSPPPADDETAPEAHEEGEGEQT
jgi:hypothetical protein